MQASENKLAFSTKSYNSHLIFRSAEILQTKGLQNSFALNFAN